MKYLPAALVGLILAAVLPGCGSGPGDVDVDAFRGRIAGDATEVMPLLAGMPAPQFTVRQADGSEFTFAAGPREKPAVITFYRGGWCPYCSRYMMDFRSAEQALLDLGYELLFISADRHEKLAAAVDQGDLEYTLLSDNDLIAARAFGLAFRVSDEYFNKLIEHDIDIIEASGREHRSLPVPAAYVVGTDGIIDFAYVNPDYRTRVDPGVLVEAARSALGRTAG